jgi:hypothetical protein
MSKTQNDLLRETARIILDFVDPNLAHDLEYKLPDWLRLIPSLRETISDEEYERELAKVRDNLPEIVAYLRARKTPPDSAMHFSEFQAIYAAKKPRNLLLPPGRSVISDEAAALEAIAALGLPELLPAGAGENGPHSGYLFWEHHASHWLLIGYHAGYPDPKKNGHEVMCLPRDRVSAQEAMALMEAAASHCGPVEAGFIGIVERGPG